MFDLSLALSTDYEETVVHNPYDGTPVGTVVKIPCTSAHLVVETAKYGAQLARKLSLAERSQILETTATLLQSDSEAFARVIVTESGRPIRQAREEVLHAVGTLRSLARPTARCAVEGEVPAGSGLEVDIRLGAFAPRLSDVIVAITSHEDSLQLIAHELGSALAGGNSIVLNPSNHTPLSAVRLASYFTAAGLPLEVMSVVTGDEALSMALAANRTASTISFRGSANEGEKLSRIVGLKKMFVEQTGSCITIVMRDCDLDRAVKSCVDSAYCSVRKGGVGPRRILVESASYQAFKKNFIGKVRALVVGDPSDDATDVGPMINEESARLAHRQIRNAVDLGATLIVGGDHRGTLFYPTVLENVSDSCWKGTCEGTTPIVILQEFRTLDDALRLVNDDGCNMSADVFTNNLGTALKAADLLDAHYVNVNGCSGQRPA